MRSIALFFFGLGGEGGITWQFTTPALEIQEKIQCRGGPTEILTELYVFRSEAIVSFEEENPTKT